MQTAMSPSAGKVEPMKAKRVKVYAADRKTVLGTVSDRATSIGASKVAGARTQYARVNGVFSWVVCEEPQR